ncbi:MAG: GGDEF domain-containing protein [Acetatifactor sp.]
MQEKKFVTTFRKLKTIQLAAFLLIEVIFVLILILEPSLGVNVFSNRALFSLCAVTWVLVIFSLLCLINDFRTLRSFALGCHELEKEAYLDNLTGIPSRHGLDMIFRTYDTPQSAANLGCYMVTISNLPEINENIGRASGDNAIYDFCNIFEKVGDAFGIVGRNGGNEFLAVLNNCTDQIMNQFIGQLNAEIASYNERHKHAPLRLHDTYVLNSEEHFAVFPQLLTATYNKLHELM